MIFMNQDAVTLVDQLTRAKAQGLISHLTVTPMWSLDGICTYSHMTIIFSGTIDIAKILKVAWVLEHTHFCDDVVVMHDSKTILAYVPGLLPDSQSK